MTVAEGGVDREAAMIVDGKRGRRITPMIAMDEGDGGGGCGIGGGVVGGGST